MAFAWQNDYCSVLCHGIYVRTLITVNSTFPIRHFFMLLKDCLLTEEREKQKNKNKNKTPEKVFVPFWYIIFTLHQLNLEEKEYNSL